MPGPGKIGPARAVGPGGGCPCGAIRTDEASNVSRLDPSGAVQVDAEHPSRNRKVEGSNPLQGASSETPCEDAVWMWVDQSRRRSGRHDGCSRAAISAFHLGRLSFVGAIGDP